MHATNPHGSEVMNCALAGTNVRSTLVGQCVGTFVGERPMGWQLCDLELPGRCYPEFGIKNKTFTKVFLALSTFISMKSMADASGTSPASGHCNAASFVANRSYSGSSIAI